ncbi:hypothetical protein MUK42_25157 [Musa troglodytarum]|uniref:1-(5-phosphoribosyl)-5-[(5-phosphoribosylamino)methylideneamino] imidazole-4-carboxamide isomerase HISN3, chloroplastic n=1 Tax=Musa troglodytarum TaxID=320322 RepID=A0A9E7IH48_9LILI|nr:hypothetical protein MUK42_25157 [Musa troglodytarum]
MNLEASIYTVHASQSTTEVDHTWTVDTTRDRVEDEHPTGYRWYRHLSPHACAATPPASATIASFHIAAPPEGMPLTTRTLPSLRWSPSTPIPLRNPLSSSHPASHWRMGRKHSKPRPISCTVRFRPCIDIHKGKVKQIVGSTLRDSTDGGASALVTNFESDKSPAEFANLYKKDGLKGGHVIMLGADAASQSAAFEALRAYPGGMQVGGGINADNAMNYLEEGASHVIVTSYIFSNGKMDLERLKHLVKMIGKNRLVLDLSCRKKDGKYAIVTDRWQKFSDVILDKETLEFLAKYSDEFLIHGVDVEGKRLGIDEELVMLLGCFSPIPVTYAGGVTTMADLEKIKTAGKEQVDVTVGSALDIFGGDMAYKEVVAWHNKQVMIRQQPS